MEREREIERERRRTDPSLAKDAARKKDSMKKKLKSEKEKRIKKEEFTRNCHKMNFALSCSPATSQGYSPIKSYEELSCETCVDK